MASRNSRYSQPVRPGEDVLFQELDGEAVLLDMTSEQYFGLNEVGTRIWQLIDTHHDLNAVFQAMSEEYAVEPEQLRRDLDGFVEELSTAGLLQFGE